MRTCLTVMALLACAVSARAELTLFAQYDWQDGATDVSGSPIRHDGVLDPGVSVADGKLIVDRYDGVDLGYMPEFDGATEALLRFEDVTFTDYLGYYAVLTGCRDEWWVAVDFDQYTGVERTTLVFNVERRYGVRCLSLLSESEEARVRHECREFTTGRGTWRTLQQ